MPKILLIDDKQDNLVSISALLKNLIPDCAVITADSGAEGIEKAGAEQPDTILIDIRMPGMDGFEVCKILKTDENTRHIPVVMLTAVKTDFPSRVKELELGADAFMAKPANRFELAAQVKAMLRIKSAEDRLREEKDQLDHLVRERTQKLREAERHYRTLFNSINDAILIHDLEGKLLEANEEACERLGYGRLELLHKTLMDIEPSLSFSSLLSRVEQIKSKGYDVFESVHLTRDGAEIPVELNSVFMVHEGKPAILTTARNIIDRKKSEAALQASEKRYKKLVESVTSYIYTVSVKDSHPLQTSHGYGCVAVTGYTAEEYGADPSLWYRMIYEKDRETVITQAEKVLSGGVVEPLEHRLVHKEGKLIWIKNTFVPQFDPEGRLVSYDGLVEDITERKTAREALQKSEEKYRNLVESTADWVWTCDLEGRLIFTNQAATKVLGYEIDEIMGKAVFDLMKPEDSNFFRERFRKSVENKKGWKNSVVHWLHKDGSTRILETSANPILDNDGSLMGFSGIDRDITARKRAEEDKAKLEAQLVQAQKMEAIGTLAGGIAHDFNNILWAIMGFTELTLISLPKGSREHNHLQQVLKASERARDLVNQILAFSRKTAQERKPLQLALIVKEAMKLLRATIPTTIEIKQDIASFPAMVLADPTQMHQVIMNLSTNAAHAMREQGGTLEVKLGKKYLDKDTLLPYPDLSPGPFVLLTFRDTGHGIAPELLERIFDPFFTTKEVGEGTGMGLAVAYGIVKSHGGRITVSSQPESGTTFTVLLPEVVSEAAGVNAVLPPIPRGRGRILVIDDDKVLIDLNQAMLESLGYEAVARSSSLEALKIFQAQPDKFDLVITDQTMPHMTGMQLSQELRRIRPDIPIILCTGYSEKVSEEKIKGLGINELLMKPINLRHLAEAARKVLDREAH